MGGILVPRQLSSFLISRFNRRLANLMVKMRKTRKITEKITSSRLAANLSLLVTDTMNEFTALPKLSINSLSQSMMHSSNVRDI
jgi:hypothetical protein